MTNKHKVEKIKHLKILQAQTLDTVHTHTHTLYVYQIDKKENRNSIKIDGRTCIEIELEPFNTS